MSQPRQPNRLSVACAFALVYLFWGSTYLGIGIAVEHIPPALVCAVRFTVAGAIMLGYCKLKGQSIRYSRQQLLQLAAVGVLLLIGGNLTLSYAEQYVPTGLAALLIAITPLWLLVLDSLLIGHHRISSRGLIGLGLGMIGTVVLIWPDLSKSGALGRRELWWSIALLGGSLSWAFGSVLSKRWYSGAPSFSATGWQVLFAGVGNTMFALLNHDLGRVTWTLRGMAAVLYLVVGGSIIGYTAYIWLLGHVPTSKVSTYAYVNPVVAVFLGWLVLHETVDKFIVAGSAIVVASVVLVTTASVVTKVSAKGVPAVAVASD